MELRIKLPRVSISCIRQRGKRQAISCLTKQVHSSGFDHHRRDLNSGFLWQRPGSENDIDCHVYHPSFQYLRISAESGQRTHDSSHSQWVGALLERPSDISNSLLVGSRDILDVMPCAYNSFCASKYSSLEPPLAQSRGEHDATWFRGTLYKGLRPLTACGPEQITETSFPPVVAQVDQHDPGNLSRAVC